MMTVQYLIEQGMSLNKALGICEVSKPVSYTHLTLPTILLV